MGKGTPLVIEKRLNILMSGQSNNVPFQSTIYCPSQYRNVYPDAYSNGAMGLGTNPFKNPVVNYQEGFTSFHTENMGNLWCWATAIVYNLSITHNRKICVTNYSVGGSDLDSGIHGGNGCWDPTLTGDLYETSRNGYFLPAIYKNNPLAETIMIWNQGNQDAGNLVASGNYYNNLLALINKWRSPIHLGGLGQKDMKVFIPHLTSDVGVYPYLAEVRQAEEDICANIPNCFLTDTSGATFLEGAGLGVHWDFSFMETMGIREGELINSIVS